VSGFSIVSSRYIREIFVNMLSGFKYMLVDYNIFRNADLI
jgi:hypothetical protein